MASLKEQHEANSLERVVGSLSSFSQQIDPMPHFIASSTCLGGGLYAHYAGKSRFGLLSGVLGASYLYAGQLIGSYNSKKYDVALGYNLATVTSAVLTAASVPLIFRSHDFFFSVMAGVGAVSLLANGNKSMQLHAQTSSDRPA
ncbi:hypothetical protein M427DRAFT_53045 [Gonapodya prolifera JEL478]|uniref:Uncharacterized protein n=1 Tax=Gonapodya prolifera (strain JEL478) TaxID=1344416 RepID=A0A139ASB0_GONPJ|nr:hypothetical protein M427DRAFT_53045 [Gonapodya prolifera JEL478]|eukprot:KXS19640.1 hypothetical protein M427DRAFT_53045 [Gonapodya prolifera JEL478]